VNDVTFDIGECYLVIGQPGKISSICEKEYILLTAARDRMSDTPVRCTRITFLHYRGLQQEYESLNKTRKWETVRKDETTLSDPFPLMRPLNFQGGGATLCITWHWY